ncbi:uncharacterized protein LOC128743080 [Sabethes cyaneus]|uniref:uncharacterized protein LOC128743080 n=1 Tax=Sabethes cyaneus TaxID=53552 RepID=UPI00237EB671|nr:uncharacterized protein LOC128743080 [Sabethes cyaneus]
MSRKITPMFNDYLYGAIRRLAVQQGFTEDLFSVDFDEETRLECDGFISFVFKAIINGDDRELVLWCKVPPNDDPRSLALFKREVYFYQEILPAMYEFQMTKDVNEQSNVGFFSAPRCYLAHCDADKEEPEAVIVLEYDENYERWDWDKFEPINLDHAKLLLQQLGRLHAVSLAMKAQKPEMFEKLKHALEDNVDFGTLMKESFDRALTTMKTRFAADQVEIQQMRDAIFSELNCCAGVARIEAFSVISHGDCWINNFIFTHNKEKAPVSVVLTDWQSVRYATPLLDLGYFFFICTSIEFRKEHWEELLKHYHNTLRTLLDRLGGNTDRQFPFAALQWLIKAFRMLFPKEQTEEDDENGKPDQIVGM